jgi:hypothetical protein
MSELCGCCEPPAGLAPLPVENRPALAALAYRMGTYSSFRQALLHGIARKGALSALSTRRSDDFAVTLLELWAAVADVLTFYQERYANEAFLRTARERESVVRLARLIDYALRPGVAASAHLAIAIDEPAGRVRIPVGLRVASVPAEDEESQTFETLEEVIADARLNALRVLPPPTAANPLAIGATAALLAPAVDVEAVDLAADDRLLVYATGTNARVEELVVEGLVSVEPSLLRWRNPVQETGWSADTPVRKTARSFSLFGHDAESAFLAPATDSAGRIVNWERVTRSNSVWTLQPTVLPLDAVYDIAVGVELLLEAPGAGVWPVVVTAVQDTMAALDPSAPFEPVGEKVTHLTVHPTGPSLPSSVDRRSARLHELVGPLVAFWGRTYPPTIAVGSLYIPGRAIDSTSIALSGGAVLDVRLIERGRRVTAADGRVAGVLGRVAAAEIVTGAIRFSASSTDRTSAAALGLTDDSATVGIISANQQRTAPLGPGAEVTVMIGSIGPRVIALAGLPAGAAAATELETRMRAADSADEFTRARVMAVGDRLLVTPGVVGATVAFGPTEADPVTVATLGLDKWQARAGLLSGQPRQLPSAAAEVAVAIGPVGPVTLSLGSSITDAETLASSLRSALRQADRAPAFAFADAYRTGSYVLVVSGDPLARVQDYLRIATTFEAPVALDSSAALLYGNVVRTGHGETVRDEVAGSGDASRAFQRLALADAPLTYVPSARAEGVASTLELLVDGVRWEEVPSLFKQLPTAQVFAAELDEQGTTTLQFGDGRNGARLPSGVDNVRATYRIGLGLAGRVRAGTLTGAIDRPAGLGDVVNPLPADGGADPETAEQARASAPRTVRTFGRAVSFRDFEELVAASSEVAKAQATWVWDGFARALHLTVARAGGGEFSATSLRQIVETLDSARDTNHTLLIANARAASIVLRATLRVRPQYQRDDVVRAAREAVEARFSFERLQLGEPVFLSDVYLLLQGVEGVSSVDVDELGFKRPPGTSAADFAAELERRGVERGADGQPLVVQPRLRIFRAHGAQAGTVRPAELAQIEVMADDLELVATGGLAR